MGEFEIERTDQYKYLGIIFDDKLNWKPQIEKMCSKLASVCGVLSKVRHYLDRQSLMLIYNSLIDSRLRYGALGWGTASNFDLKRLQVLQNKAIRFITFSDFRCSITPLFINLNLLPLNYLLTVQLSIFMYNLHCTNLPRALRDYAIPPTHRYPTSYASNLNYILPSVRTNRGKSSVKFSGPKIWSDIPTNIKLSGSRKKFSTLCKGFYLNILSESYNKETRRTRKKSDKNISSLREIFESNDYEQGTFIGFDHNLIAIFRHDNSLGEIFESDDDEEGTLIGFDNNLNSVFCYGDESSENTLWIT